jgi:hypothetical protein
MKLTAAPGPTRGCARHGAPAAPEAQALVALLRPHDAALPRQARQDDGWGSGPAETAVASLADAIRAHGAGAYARVLSSGQVGTGLTPQATQAVVAALTSRLGAAPRGKRRGLGPGVTAR